jgi:hypothetical protein
METKYYSASTCIIFTTYEKLISQGIEKSLQLLKKDYDLLRLDALFFVLTVVREREV